MTNAIPSNATPVEEQQDTNKKQLDRIERKIGNLMAAGERRSREEGDALRGAKRVEVVYPNGSKEEIELGEMLTYSIIGIDQENKKVLIPKANIRKIVILEEEEK